MSEFCEVEVGDAYVKATRDGHGWIIGTAQVEQTFSAANGGFHLRHWRNKLTTPATDYLSSEETTPFFELDVAPFLEQFATEILVRQRFDRPQTILVWDKMLLSVDAGDLLAFQADLCDETPSSLRWNIALEYADGLAQNSEPPLAAEALYTLDGSGSLEQIPGPEGEIPGAVEFNFGHRRNLTRLWRAPRAGTIRVGGSLASGRHGDLDASIRRLRPTATLPDFGSAMTWVSEAATAGVTVAGGRPAIQLVLSLKSSSLRARLHCLAYPGTGIIRHWIELENCGSDAQTLPSPAPLFLRLRPDRAWINSRMTGANNSPTQGILQRFDVTPKYRQSFGGDQARQYLPWTSLETPDGDGLFAVSESLSAWNMLIRRETDSPLLLTVNLLSYSGWTLPPGGSVELPPVTTGVFRDGLDGMGMQLYDWQYQYLWDYTNPDYYAKMTYAMPWAFCCNNLQEQFAYRLAGLDLNGADCAAAGGFDMLWDDAGWAKYPDFPVPDSYGSVFHHEYEGPDYAMTRRYLEKSGMKWLVWFCGRPSAGVMDAKTAAWGPFQWRTDSVGLFTPESEIKFRRDVREFLDRNPQSSFHTCSGGSPYAHAFGIQQLADLNYLSDFGRGDEVNYYFSYLDTPDKWVDILEPIANQLHYHHATSRHILALTPNWAFTVDPTDIELLRRNRLCRWQRQYLDL